MLVKITLFAALLLSIVVPFAYFLSGTKNKARYKLTIGTNAAAFFGIMYWWWYRRSKCSKRSIRCN